MIGFIPALILISGIFLSGCASLGPCSGKLSASGTHQPATDTAKTRLSQDLRSGKVNTGAKLSDIRLNYGDPDDMFVADCTVRFIYRLGSGKKVTLWFEDGERLSMWSSN